MTLAAVTCLLFSSILAAMQALNNPKLNAFVKQVAKSEAVLQIGILAIIYVLGKFHHLSAHLLYSRSASSAL